MGSNLSFASTETPTPGKSWCSASNDERLARVKQVIADEFLPAKGVIEPVETKTDGQVIVDLVTPLSASERGTLLLDFEEALKKLIDPGLVVWLTPLGDRSSLRNLRGIEVKA